MRPADANASPTLCLWAGTPLTAVTVSSTPKSLTWTATWAPKASATWRKDGPRGAPGGQDDRLRKADDHTCAVEFVRGGDEAPNDVLGRLPTHPLGEQPPIVRISAQLNLLDLVRGVPHSAEQEQTEHAVGQRATCRDAVGGAHGPRQGPCPPDVELARVLGGSQSDKPAQPLQASLKGEATEGDGVVASISHNRCKQQKPRSHLPKRARPQQPPSMPPRQPPYPCPGPTPMHAPP